MTSVLPDPATEFGARVARRLREEHLAWLTVVDGAGTPQPSPVWFLWDEDSSTVLVYNRAGAKRLEHLRRNPRVALHLDGNGEGGDIVVLTGSAVEAPAYPPPAANAPYLDKYAGRIARTFGTPEHFGELYPVPVEITVRRTRGH